MVGKRKKCVAAGGSAAPTETVENDDQTLLLDDCVNAEVETVKYDYKDPSIDLSSVWDHLFPLTERLSLN